MSVCAQLLSAALAVCEAVDHQAEGEVEPVVALAGGELGGVAGGVGEGLGRQGGEPAQQFVAVEDPNSVIMC